MKTFKEFLGESEAATNVDGPAVALNPVPLIKTSRWAGKTEITIPHKNYQQVYKGRSRGTKWGVDDPVVQKAISGALYKEGQALVTSDLTGGSVLLHHKKIQRMKADQDFTISEQTCLVGSVTKSLNEDSDTDGILNINWVDDDGDLDDRGAQDDIFTPAYDYSQFQLGLNSDQAQFFADVVLRVSHLWDRSQSVDMLSDLIDTVFDALAAQETSFGLTRDQVNNDAGNYISVKNILFKESEMIKFSEFVAESEMREGMAKGESIEPLRNGVKHLHKDGSVRTFANKTQADKAASRTGGTSYQSIQSRRFHVKYED